ncbi:hypothetical protein PoB_000515500 [Plakobranchus ocellatus]|uniref:Uncharacterized protein n=1 Tax=Plakobranchus ocellatus TaxID=259542 RepID=A0AAV3Y6C8_9GAST|nr:hypothetical protein PoB_000515500 [Plakobranchus ocellatus]
MWILIKLCLLWKTHTQYHNRHLSLPADLIHSHSYRQQSLTQHHNRHFSLPADLIHPHSYRHQSLTQHHNRHLSLPANLIHPHSYRHQSAIPHQAPISHPTSQILPVASGSGPATSVPNPLGSPHPTAGSHQGSNNRPQISPNSDALTQTSNALLKFAMICSQIGDAIPTSYYTRLEEAYD